MGAAWKGVRDGDARFEQVLDTIRNVSKLGMEVCVTLGSLSLPEAQKLKAAGVTAYNHNIDTSPEFYPEIVTTHTFQDRLDTIAAVQEADMSLCCGGIIGMGETEDDRLKMLEVLTGFDPAPESVPINCLMAMPGTPLEDQHPVDVFELVRLIATTRIALPRRACGCPPAGPASLGRARRSVFSLEQILSSTATNFSRRATPSPTRTWNLCGRWIWSPLVREKANNTGKECLRWKLLMLLTLDRRDFRDLLDRTFYGLRVLTPGRLLRIEREAGRLR